MLRREPPPYGDGDLEEAVMSNADTMISVFHLAATGAGPARLANEMATRDFPGAGQRVGNHCNVDPNLFRIGG
jgi:hypothetical protein